MEAYDLLVIGAGPGGYVAAIRAAQLGMRVGVVEKEKALGGTCLRVGCIPSKALLETTERIYEVQKGLIGAKVEGLTLDLPALMAHKDRVVGANTQGIEFLFRKNGIARHQGTARFLSERKVRVEETGEELSARYILIATGSAPLLPPWAEVDLERVVTSTEALSFPEVPERLIVVGGGVIGLELGVVWHRLGAEVVVLEYLDRILPTMDAELSRAAERVFRKEGLEIRTRVRVQAVRPEGKGARVELEGGEVLEADRVLLAVGRRPYTEGLSLENAGLATDERGRIPVDEHLRTQVPHIYAIGDVVRGPMLAHKASEEGIAAVEHMVRGYGHVDYLAIPSVVYTHPEVAGVGYTEEELKAQGIPYKVGKFPYSASGRARAMGETEGFVKVLAHAQTDRILGVHGIGARVGDVLAEAALALFFKASAEDVGRAPHAHPSLSEILKEAALGAWERPIHL
ncbi:dihydrolipoyl dehydrogenase [Thermus thermamylovorans]|uniref:Dihydrolipoyl dehydrogenase n=1 Tax=Thermus thermamylovorans TaxID=2509362 RepID=A0A4Q9B4D4_9DEIN|nr:dihydrolipoyl dehydrogenase [Thermus thermamylovorans]TBH20798.1 dihydrolipoyl dehydrogenase [Thermus thermamylovorans]